MQQTSIDKKLKNNLLKTKVALKRCVPTLSISGHFQSFLQASRDPKGQFQDFWSPVLTCALTCGQQRAPARSHQYRATVCNCWVVQILLFTSAELGLMSTLASYPRKGAANKDGIRCWVMYQKHSTKLKFIARCKWDVGRWNVCTVNVTDIAMAGGQIKSVFLVISHVLMHCTISFCFRLLSTRTVVKCKHPAKHYTSLASGEQNIASRSASTKQGLYYPRPGPCQ